MTYPPLSSRHRMRGCLSFAASGFVGQGSACRGQWGGKLGFAGRFKLGRSFLTLYRDICYFDLFLPTGKIIASMPVLSLFLCIPFEDG